MPEPLKCIIDVTIEEVGDEDVSLITTLAYDGALGLKRAGKLKSKPNEAD